ALKSKEDLDQLLAQLEGCEYLVDEVKKGSRKRRPYAPFTTSTLQQSASRSLGFTSKRTMSAAQNLYEGVILGEMGQTSLVSYIRTDSVRVAPEAVTAARDLIESTYGKAYLPAKAPFYRNKSKAQDAHEAIRPSHFDLPPAKVKAFLSNDQYRIYEMIWNRFLASQMEAAVYDKLGVDILAGDNLFRARGETLIFPGWLTLYGHREESKDESPAESPADDNEPELVDIPPLVKGDILQLKALVPEQKFTQPPPRYTEASLIREMEELGIGRPSTYAPTISTLFDRLYVEREGRQLKPTELGTTVTGMLEAHFGKIVDTDFTADMESELDEIEAGDRDWVDVLEAFYRPFHEDVI
ncbi:MAG TPA: DNA topoisomerase, partial [Clostridia bacterium]|nr:DNA topoisomerase [Clostridia bacterium]